MAEEVFKRICRSCGIEKICGGKKSQFSPNHQNATHIWYCLDCKDCRNKIKSIERANRKKIKNKRIKISRKTKTKICKKCGQRKILEKFGYIRKRADGFIYRRGTCLLCEEKAKPKREIKNKICIKCGKKKKVEEFSPNLKRKDGTILYRSVCKKCVRPVNREKSAISRRQKLLAKQQEYLKTYEQKIHELFS